MFITKGIQRLPCLFPVPGLWWIVTDAEPSGSPTGEPEEGGNWRAESEGDTFAIALRMLVRMSYIWRCLFLILAFSCEHEIYTGPNYNWALSRFLVAKLELDSFDENNFDSNIRKIAAYVNQILIVPYKYVAETPGTAAEKSMFLDSMERQRSMIREQLEPMLPQKSWLRQYLELPVLEMDSYCQKASLATSELLAILGIPSRQIHMTQNGTGFHQFLDYWQPFQQQWVIIDPFYGIQYVDRNQNLMGFEQAIRVKNTVGITEGNVLKIDINRFYYYLEHLEMGWKAQWRLEPSHLN